MLATRNRLRASADFSNTVRSGVRNGRRNLVLYAALSAADEPTKVGFIVAKTVGNAVARNLVKRRLREAAAATVRQNPAGLNIVVRALPVSAGSCWPELVKDYQNACLKTLDRLAAGRVAAPDKEGNNTP
ncbi:MAG: ribonuclease P protein component [Actinomycetota bacterium]|uniref:ribonuclease P protein component n=1 Tax=Micrococcaceae TaxID=1268 RepID=UPI0024B9E7B5|nr:ribonuclease P protein component [Paenarthrobacter sp. PH39-S1]MDJ0355776.1 ribonuclease P protein component [Paenarthrobacter sp. PH39-S1]MDQ6739630.1 ribonuclease P protein component [Actinomycetota bacterium]